MRNIIAVVFLGLIACDSPGDTGAITEPVSCQEGYQALCDAICPGSSFFGPDGTSTWSTAEECHQRLVLSGYTVRDEGWGCIYDDGTSYAACLDAVHRIDCDDPGTTADALTACSRPVTP